MKWHPGSSPYYIVSDEGYKIAKHYVRDIVKYTAYSPAKKCIGIALTSGHARQMCEDHGERP